MTKFMLMASLMGGTDILFTPHLGAAWHGFKGRVTGISLESGGNTCWNVTAMRSSDNQPVRIFIRTID